MIGGTMTSWARRMFAAALAVAAASLNVHTAQAQGLAQGRYECWFQGQARGLLNFAITGPSTYTDSGGSPGTYVVSGRNVRFRGAGLDGQSAVIERNGSVTFLSPRGAGLATCDVAR